MRRKTRNPVSDQRCPICNKYEKVGDQGYNRFFCRDCFIEFRVYTKIDKENNVELKLIDVYDIGESGASILINTETIEIIPLVKKDK